MSFRMGCVVALLAAFGVCRSAVASRTTTMRGQLALTFSVDDRGSASYSSSTQDLRLELTIAGDGTAKLRVRGHIQRRGAVISPAPGKSRTTGSEAEVDDHWVGRAKRTRGVTMLDLALVTKDRDRDPLTFQMSCKRTRESLQDAPSSMRVALHRCTPVTKFEGSPWSDLLPHYVRVPLAFAERGDVLLLVVGDHERASVQPPVAVRSQKRTKPGER